MADRVTLTKTCYMKLDGQWQIVLSGSVIDVDKASDLKGVCAPVAESAGNLGTGNSHKPVRNMRYG
jgi:hypothetical protein